jgi:hypothetical protein
MVQASHAAYEAGKHGTEYIPSLVLCETETEAALLREATRLEQEDIPHIIFREPDLCGEATAIATLPLCNRDRRKLKNWVTWR